MIEVTVERKDGRTLLVFRPKDRIDLNTFKKMLKHRFDNAYTPDYYIYKGPDTDRAEATALEIAATYNSKQK